MRLWSLLSGTSLAWDTTECNGLVPTWELCDTCDTVTDQGFNLFEIQDLTLFKFFFVFVVLPRIIVNMQGPGQYILQGP